MLNGTMRLAMSGMACGQEIFRAAMRLRMDTWVKACELCTFICTHLCLHVTCVLITEVSTNIMLYDYILSGRGIIAS